MDLLVVFGPPASGKMTVGQAIVARSRYRLFHNHMTIEPLLGLFAFTSPAFQRLVDGFRLAILDECLRQDEFDLVFTYVWALDEDGDARFVADLDRRVTEAGGTTRYVELVCPQPERLARNRTPGRLDAKRSKRDLAWSDGNLRTIDANHRTTSRPGEMASRVDHYLRVENADLPADDAAARIVEHWRLPGAAAASSPTGRR